MVQGMQQSTATTQHRMVAAEMKHWTAYGVEGNMQHYRMKFDANVSLHDLVDSYDDRRKFLSCREFASRTLWCGSLLLSLSADI